MIEYFIHCWGGAWNDDASPSIEKDHGIKAGYHYFQDKDEKEAFVAILNKPEYKTQGIVFTEECGEMSHKQTVFVGTFAYDGKEWTIHYNFGYEFAVEDAIFMFTNGNYSCDCNICSFIKAEYGEDAIPELPCGFEIKLLEYHFEFID